MLSSRVRDLVGTKGGSRAGLRLLWTGRESIEQVEFIGMIVTEQDYDSFGQDGRALNRLFQEQNIP